MPKLAHYLLDQIHSAAEHLQYKQDQILRKTDFHRAKHSNQLLKARTRVVCNLRIHWVPGHCDFTPNYKADEATKRAAWGESSNLKDLPSFLCKPIPHSIAALHQEYNAWIQRQWVQCWRKLPHYCNMHNINKSLTSKSWLKLDKPLNCTQASTLMQLCLGHIALNKHLHCIKRSTTLLCPNCDENSEETIHHFLFICTRYCREWLILHNKLHRHSHDLPYLLSHHATIAPLLHFVNATGRFKQTFGNIISENQPICG